MNRRNRVDDVFNIELGPSTSSSQSDVYSSDSHYLCKDRIDRGHFPRVQQTRAQVLNSGFSDENEIERENDFNQFSNITVTNGRATIREKAINFMPSRMGMQRAITPSGQILSTSSDNEVEELTHEIERNESLMEDSPFGEQQRIETLKAMPQSLTIKRQIKVKLTRRVTDHSKLHFISKLKRIKYSFGMLFNKIKGFFKNIFSNIELWYSSIKTIEGHFGSGVAAYFKFLRWLFTLNLLLLVLTVGFITIPQIIFNNMDNDEINATTNINSTKIIPKQVEYTFSALDLLTAEGYLTTSVLFYGAYTNMTFSISPPREYSLPFAYFMTMICLYMATFVIISMSMAKSYRRSFIETSGGVQNMYAHKVFCSWDFGISIAKAAELKHISIFNELKEMLAELNRSNRKQSRIKRFWNRASQVTAHFLVFFMLAGLASVMWVLLKKFEDTSDFSPWTALYLSLAVNGTMLVLHSVFGWIAHMEEYHSPRTTLHVNLFRNFLLEIIIIGVLIVFWLTRNQTECWETSIGQEIYRLVIIDFLVATIGTALFQAIRFLIYRKFYPEIDLPEFDISRGSLGLVFNQTLLWVGLLFSPLLATVITIKMVLTFYIKMATLIYFCKAPSQLWRSAQTQTLYLVLVFLSLLGVVIGLGYIITQVEVSKHCGPFRGHAYMFQIFVDGILELKEEHLFWRILMSVTKPAVIGGLLLSMCVIVYYLRAKSKARIAMVKLLKEMLYFEGKDKEFLLANITKVTQGNEWLFDEDILDSTRDKTCYAESSSTWQYKTDPNYLRGDKNRQQIPSTSGQQQQSTNNNDNFIRNRRY